MIQTVVGPAGAQGEQGPKGDTGAKGAKGEKGDAGTLQTNALCAQNMTSERILSMLKGSGVPLPEVSHNDGWTVSEDNKAFTVPEAGAYLISYQISIDKALALGTTIYVNGKTVPNLDHKPGGELSSFAMSAIISLKQGDKVQLTMYGLTGEIAMGSAGAAVLTALKVA